VKAWHPVLTQHVATWSQKLPKYRSWWPRYVYHFTNVANAVNIIRSGALLSREAATRARLMLTDNASAAVIQTTAASHLALARMYFRPRTPTQFHNEGIRPRARRTQLNAHCAMPVFFFFDLVSVLAADESSFSDGNIASGRAWIRNDEASFRSIPFEDVYSDGGMGTRAGDLTFRRHAEILVPNKLELSPHLQVVCCRSIPERQTLLYLLQSVDPNLRTEWEHLVRVATDPIFERRATYVEAVAAIGDTLRFTFNPASQFAGPFELRFSFASDTGSWTLQSPNATLAADYSIRLQNVAGAVGIAELTLDGDLAFKAPVTFGSAPF
jgi:hypothetical protein